MAEGKSHWFSGSKASFFIFHLRLLKPWIRSVANSNIYGVLIITKAKIIGFFDNNLLWLERWNSVRVIAEVLFQGFPAATPPIFPSFKFHNFRHFICNDWVWIEWIVSLNFSDMVIKVNAWIMNFQNLDTFYLSKFLIWLFQTRWKEIKPWGISPTSFAFTV